MLRPSWRHRATRRYVTSSLQRVLSATSQHSCATSCSPPFRTSPLYHDKTRRIPWQPSFQSIRSFSSKSPSDTQSTTITSDQSIPTTNLRIPTSPQSHNSLITFLHHAHQTNLSIKSTTYLGTRYEYLIQSHLSTLSFNLTRIGGRGDSGIDLLGTWNLPSVITQHTNTSTSTPAPPLRVLIQCKRLSKKPGPNLIRELEGSIRGAPAAFRQPETLSILICSQPATKGIRDAMGKSARGLMWCYMEELPIPTPESDTDLIKEMEADQPPVPETRMRQLLWNRAAAVHCGLEGLDVGMKYIGRDGLSGEDEKEVVLLWQGRPLNFSVGSQSSETVQDIDE